MLQAGRDGVGLSEVPDQRDDDRAGVRLLEALQDGEGAVAAPVVDEEDLVALAQLRDDALQPAVEFGEDVLVVVHRYHDAEVAYGRHHPSSRRPPPPPIISCRRRILRAVATMGGPMKRPFIMATPLSASAASRSRRRMSSASATSRADGVK